MPSFADCSEFSLIYTGRVLSFLAIWVGYVASAVSFFYNQIMFLNCWEATNMDKIDNGFDNCLKITIQK